MFFHANTIKKGQTMTYMPNTIFHAKQLQKRPNFWNFGLKNSNLATLLLTAPKPVSECYVTERFVGTVA